MFSSWFFHLHELVSLYSARFLWRFFWAFEIAKVLCKNRYLVVTIEIPLFFWILLYSSFDLVRASIWRLNHLGNYFQAALNNLINQYINEVYLWESAALTLFQKLLSMSIDVDLMLLMGAFSIYYKAMWKFKKPLPWR